MYIFYIIIRNNNNNKRIKMDIYLCIFFMRILKEIRQDMGNLVNE